MISVEELPEPRPHHYVFAHHWLPRFAQSNPAAFFSLFSTQDGQDAIASFWDTVGESLAPALRMPSEGLDVHWTLLHAGIHALIVQLPPPKAMPEAYFVAAISLTQPDGEEKEVPVFSLQYAWNAETSTAETIAASWDGEGYELIGPGPEPTLEEWTTWLRLRFTPLLN
jgi:hypothetical protein